MKIQIPSYEFGATLDANAPSTSTMQHHTYNPRALSSFLSSSLLHRFRFRFGLVIGARWWGFQYSVLGGRGRIAQKSSYLSILIAFKKDRFIRCIDFIGLAFVVDHISGYSCNGTTAQEVETCMTKMHFLALYDMMYPGGRGNCKWRLISGV